MASKTRPKGPVNFISKNRFPIQGVREQRGQVILPPLFYWDKAELHESKWVILAPNIAFAVGCLSADLFIPCSLLKSAGCALFRTGLFPVFTFFISLSSARLLLTGACISNPFLLVLSRSGY